MEQIQKVVLLLSFAGSTTLAALILAGTVPLGLAGPALVCLVLIGFFANQYLKVLR